MVVCKEGTQDIWGENALRTLKWAADFGLCFTQLKQTASVHSFPCRLKQTSVFGWDTGMGRNGYFLHREFNCSGLSQNADGFPLLELVGEALRLCFHWIGNAGF